MPICFQVFVSSFQTNFWPSDSQRYIFRRSITSLKCLLAAKNNQSWPSHETRSVLRKIFQRIWRWSLHLPLQIFYIVRSPRLRFFSSEEWSRNARYTPRKKFHLFEHGSIQQLFISSDRLLERFPNRSFGQEIVSNEESQVTAQTQKRDWNKNILYPLLLRKHWCQHGINSKLISISKTYLTRV